MKIRLSKSEMGYYRALKKQKAAWDEVLANGGLFAERDGGGGRGLCQLGYEKYHIEQYDTLCARIRDLRGKGTRGRSETRVYRGDGS